MKLRGKVILISGLVVFIITNVFFFMLTKERSNITWLGYVFILFAEVDFFGGLVLIEFLANKNSQIIIRTGIGFTITAYMLLTIVVSLIYMIFSINRIASFLAIQLTIFAIAFILSVIFYGTAKAVKAE